MDGLTRNVQGAVTGDSEVQNMHILNADDLCLTSDQPQWISQFASEHHLVNRPHMLWLAKLMLSLLACMLAKFGALDFRKKELEWTDLCRLCTCHSVLTETYLWDKAYQY
eukprot:1161439-Pelagomonas_calceolata.AAC.1